MKNNKSIKVGLAIGIIFLVIVSTVTPMAIGNNVKESNKETIVENYNFDRYHYPEYYDCYNIDEIPEFEQSRNSRKQPSFNNIDPEKTIYPDQPTQTLDGLMDSPWSMYCHDTRHTGRSPYSTVDTWVEIWQIYYERWFIESGIVIANDGTTYYGSFDLFAANPDGAIKWIYDIEGWILTCPTIDENGTIYVGTAGNSYMHAIYPNGTEKWKYPTSQIYSSPVIADDGTIVFGDSENHRIIALSPDGNLIWTFNTNHVIYSSPAIGLDVTVYCGSHDTYLYALYLNNGTLKWKYKTGHWIRTSPCIADDGTIYVVSLDGYLHAVNPDGSLKWKTDVGAGTSPTIGQDGTIYCGYDKLHAINPINGSVKWTFDVGGKIRGATPCNSIDGTIYFGTHIGDFNGGEVIAINSEGLLKWRKMIANRCVESPPAISDDGTVYIGSSWYEEVGGSIYDRGYLYAFGVGKLEADANGPYFGLIDIPVQFEGSSKGGYSPHTYFWNFGDGDTSDEQNPTYTYTNADNYTVTLTVTDNTSNSSGDTSWAWIQTSNTPPNKPTISGETYGDVGTSYDYTFLTTDPEGLQVWYYVDWGDNTNTGWLGPYNNGQTITRSHTWGAKGIYNISCKAKDPYDAEGPWGYLEVEMPVNQYSSNHQMSNTLLFQILGRILNRLQL